MGNKGPHVFTAPDCSLFISKRNEQMNIQGSRVNMNMSKE